MSPKRGETTARNPWSWRAHTACSREEPVPKLGPATRIVAPACSGRLRTKVGSARQAENSPSPKPVRSTLLSHSAGMIWSVSTSERSSGTAVPVTVLVGSMSVQLLWGGEAAGDGRSRGDGRGHQVGAPAGALTALEVAVRRRCAALARAQLVGVHGQAHRAARLSPLEAGRGEGAIETLRLGPGLDLHGAWDDQGAQSRSHPSPSEHRGRSAEVLQPGARAGADERG